MATGEQRIIYRTATSLDGFIADADNSLQWLFAVEPDSESQAAEHEAFLDGIGAIVEGSTTYEWVLAETDLLAQPTKWQQFYGDRPTFVFTSRQLPRPDGADVRFVRGAVSAVLPEIRAAADGGHIWVAGGGDLVGQFFDIGALDRIEVSVAPVTLGGGAPLLPRRIEAAQMQLVDSSREGQFIHARYNLSRAR